MRLRFNFVVDIYPIRSAITIYLLTCSLASYARTIQPKCYRSSCLHKHNVTNFLKHTLTQTLCMIIIIFIAMAETMFFGIYIYISTR